MRVPSPQTSPRGSPAMPSGSPNPPEQTTAGRSCLFPFKKRHALLLCAGLNGMGSILLLGFGVTGTHQACFASPVPGMFSLLAGLGAFPHRGPSRRPRQPQPGQPSIRADSLRRDGSSAAIATPGEEGFRGHRLTAENLAPYNFGGVVAEGGSTPRSEGLLQRPVETDFGRRRNAGLAPSDRPDQPSFTLSSPREGNESPADSENPGRRNASPPPIHRGDDRFAFFPGQVNADP